MRPETIIMAALLLCSCGKDPEGSFTGECADGDDNDGDDLVDCDDPDCEGDPDCQPEADADADADADTDTDADADADADPDADTDADTDADPDADTDADTDSDTDSDLENAVTLKFDGDGLAKYSDEINPAGNRDFYFIQPDTGYFLQVYTENYHLEEDGVPDTVLRLYDSQGEFLTEDDDFPYWSWGTDSALFFQATDPDGYYVEVLEWSDWSPDSSGASGGATYDYDLYLQLWEVGWFEWGGNDDKKKADDTYDYSLKSSKNSLYWAMFDDGVTQFFGEIESKGDVDVWPLEFSDSEVGYYAQWAFWTGAFGEIEPLVSLYDEDWTLLAQTGSPNFEMDWIFAYDAAITYRIPDEGRLYLVVEDANGAGGEGTGYFYPGTFAYYDSTLADHESESNDLTLMADQLSMAESSSTNDYWYGRFSGALDDSDDAADNFYVSSDDVGGLAGTYLSVHLETERQGSLLDGKISVYKDLGDGTFELLGEASTDPKGSGDPAVWDLALKEDADIYITVEHDTKGDVGEPSHYYLGTVDIYTSTLFQ